MSFADPDRMLVFMALMILAGPAPWPMPVASRPVGGPSASTRPTWDGGE